MNNYLLSLILLITVTQTQANVRIFSGLDLRSNTEVSLDYSSAKHLVVYFVSSSCPCSQSHFDHLNNLQKVYKDFEFVGFHSLKTANKKKVLEYFKKFKIDFPIILDQKLKIADSYKALKTPHVYILDAEGEVLFQGGATNSRSLKRATKFYLKDALTSLSKGEKLKNKNVKTLGCYIKR